MSFAWPRRSSDLPLERGEWEFVLETATSTASYGDDVVTYSTEPDPLHDLEYDVVIDKDDDLATGTLPVALVLAGEVQDDAGIADALDVAIPECTALFASVGITLDISWHSWPEGDFGPPESDTTGVYRQIAESLPPFAVPLVLLPVTEEFFALVGVSPVPGPLVPTETSAVVVAPRGVGPPNGAFSPAQATQLGRVMAHELGHYLGLVHAVEPYPDFDHYFDDLDDTSECAGYDECVDLVGTNLMFPIACGPDCQGETSPLQGDVMHYTPGVR